MRVRDLMTRRVISVQPADSLEMARQLFRTNNIHHLVVVDGEQVAGVVTHREVTSRLAGTVQDVMVRTITTIDAEATLKSAASVMLGGSTGCLPVLEDGKLAGIVTTTDLMKAVNGEATLPFR